MINPGKLGLSGVGVLLNIILLTSSAQATDYTLSDTISVPQQNQEGSSSTQQVNYFTLDTPYPLNYDLNPGDTISGTINFEQSYTRAPFDITVDSPAATQDFIALLFRSNGGNVDVSYTSTFTLLGLRGSDVPANPGSDDGSSTTGVFAAGLGTIPGGDFSFSGFTYSVTLTGSNSESAGPFAFEIEEVGANTSDFLTFAQTPEPSTWGMLSGGLMALGWIMRRRGSAMRR